MKRIGKTTLLSLTLVILGMSVGMNAEAADFGFKDLAFSLQESNGEPAMGAGGHPFSVTTELSVNSEIDPELGEVPVGTVKDLKIELPGGLVGIPTATPRCSGEDFVDIELAAALPACSNDSAVGLARLRIGDKAPELFEVPIYNLEPSPGKAAKLGFIALGVPVVIDLRVSEAPPYSVIAELSNIPQPVRFYGSLVSIWGNPADPRHDPVRGSCAHDGGECPTSIAAVPFLVAPRSCKGSLVARFEAVPWESPAARVFGEAETMNGTDPIGLGECGELRFAPTIAAQPTNRAAESPSGLDFDLNVNSPGLTDPEGKADSDITRAEVVLPQGVTLNPSQAEGLGVCTEAELGREGSASEPGEGCPQSAKVGTVEVETPLLKDEILNGSLYVAKPYDNPTSSLIGLYMVIKNRELGIAIKLAGKVAPDSQTGQLITTFDNLPELPFSHFHLHFREGGRSPLITPPNCGRYTAKAVLTPSANPAAPYITTAGFEISSGVANGPCPAAGQTPFDPGFVAGAANNSAGAYSPFSMRLTRRDGDQDITRFSSVLPPGVVGKIAGLSRCSQVMINMAKAKTGLQELASPSCPLNSAIGHTLSGAGVGSQLTYVRGTLYLGGPYNGDPLSVVAIVPAVAGPFDVGTVVVQEALTLNSSTGEVEVDGSASDPIPHILAGIPLKLQDLRVYVDRPNFILNPTSCDPFRTEAMLWGGGVEVFNIADDVAVRRSSRFQAASCGSLGFKPDLGLRLVGGTDRGDHPALKSALSARPGDANIGKAVVTLPPSEFIDNAHIQNPCTRVQFNASQCPRGSILGVARAVTPLLDEPLEGPVYFRSNGGERLLPDVVADLKGLVRIILVGEVDSVKGRIRTTFRTVPDAPVTKFSLRLYGGRKGLLVNNRDLCSKKLSASIKLEGQNGMMHDTNPAVGTSCAKNAKRIPRRPGGQRPLFRQMASAVACRAIFCTSSIRTCAQASDGICREFVAREAANGPHPRHYPKKLDHSAGER